MGEWLMERGACLRWSRRESTEGAGLWEEQQGLERVKPHTVRGLDSPQSCLHPTLPNPLGKLHPQPLRILDTSVDCAPCHG